VDERFSQIYQLLFDNYQISNELPVSQGGLGSPPVSALIRTLINNVDSEPARRHLRADGKYFLLVNFYSMVYMPIFLSSNVNFQGVMEAIYADIRNIVESARTAEVGDDEISGHAINNIVAVKWRELRTTQFRIWGD
jgi:hypothetical protein